MMMYQTLETMLHW